MFLLLRRILITSVCLSAWVGLSAGAFKPLPEISSANKASQPLSPSPSPPVLPSQLPPPLPEATTVPNSFPSVEPSIDPPLSPSVSPSMSPSAAPNPTPSPFPTVAPSLKPATWVKPVEGTKMNPFGNSYAFYGYWRSGHTGLDIAAPVGTRVSAVADGVIAKIVTTANMRYGTYLVLQHTIKPYFSLYAHLQRVDVRLGATVKAGQKIAFSGKSGLASFPHLHFEVLDRVPVHDGAWGYRYICPQSTVWIHLRDGRRLGQVAGLPWLKEHIGFAGADLIEVQSILRFSQGRCQELPIAPLTYFNPQALLPVYPTGPMPDLSGKHRT